ncbi:MAG: SIMPL domain-containing protein [Eubacteriales bacterium]
MKKHCGKLVFIGIVALLLMTYGAGLNGIPATANQDPAKSSLNVSGQGKVSAKPDMAYVTAGVTTDAKTAKDALTENNQLMEKVINTIKAEGISDNDIQTSSYNLSPRYDYISQKNGGGRQVLLGYTATNEVRVTVRNINAVGKVLDSVVSAGANLSGGITFTLSEGKMEKAYAEALTAALKNAEGKAQTLAKGLGVIIGQPKEVSEGGSNPRSVYNEAFYDKAMAAAPQVPVSPGQMEISAAVSLRYEY